MRQAVNQRIRINILRVSFLLLVPIILFVRPHIALEGIGHEVIETVGTLLLIAGVLGRFWSILYVGGVKNAEVMQDGPYSMTRNPLYVASTVAAFGIGLMLGAFGFALLLGGVVGGVLYITARRESAFLEAHFGAVYRDYADRVPFFFPDPRLFRSKTEVTFRTNALRRNLFDAMVFLSFIPLVELIDSFKLHFGWSLPGLW
ncbi:methyltransferase family protein [Paracoccus tegillarcae]|uniref:Isoprenylcysteine carboxylmethyltransferase family protein n=1 Tax=Paracoccus tegillarcae TaxID=1529068 RepID=A0A2K9EJY8_9RHOB|nr:isoprenylcysteine carboxylmethyltransferase family protein [Paracoccus tegillarcae]AUH33697.1 isoprenylcysteine carboxylmethyltransferase family protein [Paracoccus tegillarcae]